MLTSWNNSVLGDENIFIFTRTQYSWTSHQMDIATTLACLLSRSDFKSETSFEFPSPNYTGQST